MAKKEAGFKTKADDTSTIAERFYYYDKLNFIPVEEKNELWGAQFLAFVKNNAVQFVTTAHAAKMRAIEQGEIDKEEYKKMIDPSIPDSIQTVVDGRRGNTVAKDKRAEFFHADWKPCPIFVHLNNILDAKIEQIPLNLGVKASDEYSQLKLQKINSQILGRKNFSNFINDFNGRLGMPPLSNGADPFRYANELKNGIQKKEPQKIKNPQNKSYKQPPTDMIESIKAQIGDDPEGLALFNSFIYKSGPETACEIGIKHYMLDENRFLNKVPDIVSDLKNFNKFAVRFYTSETTGRPVIEQLPIDHLYTLPFKQRDGSDMKAWFIEYDITFGEFIQMFGADLNQQQLLDVFVANKKLHGIEERDYETCSFNKRQNAKTRIGYFEFETQNMDVYSKYEAYGNPKFRKVESKFVPNEVSTRVESHYNVWYKFYYIPTLLETSLADFNLNNQAKTIYKFGKLQDQQREGDDYRYAKSSLVLYQSKQLSWADIMNSIMPKINFLWFQFQNEMVNAMPNGIYFAEELITAMVGVVDTAGNDNQSAGYDFMRRIKQTGSGVGKTLRDPDGKVIGDGKPFWEVKSTMMQGAFEKLEGMMSLYQILMQSLGQSDISEGNAPKPRQNLGGIQLALAATTQSQFFIEKPYMELVLELARKHIYYFKEIVDEQDSDRLQDFMDIVGAASGTAWEAIKDIPFHNLGLTVENVMTDEQRAWIKELAGTLSAAGVLLPEDAIFISMIDDVKYAYAILSLKAKAGRKALAQIKQDEQQAAQQQAQMVTQLKIEEIKALGANTLANTNLAKQWDIKTDQLITQMKGEFQIELKKLVSQSRITEDITRSNIELQNQPAEEKAVA